MLLWSCCLEQESGRAQHRSQFSHISPLPVIRLSICISSQPHHQRLLLLPCASPHLCNIWWPGLLRSEERSPTSVQSHFSAVAAPWLLVAQSCGVSTAQVAAWWVGKEGQGKEREQWLMESCLQTQLGVQQNASPHSCSMFLHLPRAVTCPDFEAATLQLGHDTWFHL